MRNRILSLTRNTIPYVKELQPLTGSVAGCILMQQLDYWFDHYPNGFWKFLEPSGHPRFKKGDSWVEELGMSVDEFRTAFDKIGIRYKSKGSFDLAQDKFQGKFYSSYFDRRENLTYYHRNHVLVDKALDDLISINDHSVTVNRESPFTVNRESPFTVNGESPYQQIGKVNLQEMGNPHLLDTENTFTEIKQIPLQLQAENEFFILSGSKSELIFPRQLHIEQKNIIFKLLQHLQPHIQQNLLDELEGALRSGTIKRTPTSFMQGLVLKEKQGQFNMDLGMSVQTERKQQSIGFQKQQSIKPALQCDRAAQEKGMNFFKNKKLKKRLSTNLEG